ncbi:MAG: N-acetylglucosaminyltransferase [Parcubacteria bacterium C7867-001]|nr:MAG: N-acetylglucosaminyltransferase [Parcubacteria bacterium C7867-001]
MTTTTLEASAVRTPFTAIGRDAGLWFCFFAIIYLILIIKFGTGSYWNDNLFFRIYSLTITGYIFSRFILSHFHKKIAVDLNYEPTIAFVVPAKNEEDNIAKTIECFAAVDYPAEKIEVIAINDGSTDRTYEEMVRAARSIQQHVARVEVVDWKVNRGKRAGMAEGIHRATHDIVVFIDSDSFIERGAVRHLVKYFSDPTIGAVSGHTDVYNRDTNMLTQMQALRYYIAFKIYKAAESVFGFVTCCPGCCSAYRRSYLLEFVDEWHHQRFLGTECTFGDDRSLTNFILRKYRAAYSAEALAHTVAPDSISTYVRQQQRWKKSWVRETFIAASFVWRKHPVAAFFFYAYVFLALAGPIVFLHAMVWNPILYGILPLVYLSGLFLMLMLHGIYYRIYVGKRPWFLAVLSFWFYSVILMWQLPWAVVTIADTRWGTR